MPCVLATPALPKVAVQQLQREFTVHVLPASGNVTDIAEVNPQDIRAIATPGVKTGCGRLTSELFDQLPALEIISSYSSGIEGIDARAAIARGIAVAHAPDVLVEPVADIALALALDITRGVTAGDRYVRAGRWAAEGNLPLATLAGGRTAGILGLGRIGKAVATRLQACGMSIAYHGRRPQPAFPYRYYGDLRALAQDSDLLVVCCPATPETRNIVNAEVLQALGPQGFLVNVARGSIIDEAALIAALRAGAIAAAGLDVWMNEPNPDAALIALDNLVILPHLGGSTLETRQGMFDTMAENLRRHFSGQALLSPFSPD